MTLRQFNLIMFAGIATVALVHHDWLCAMGWSTAALLQAEHVLDELEANKKSRTSNVL